MGEGGGGGRGRERLKGRRRGNGSDEFHLPYFVYSRCDLKMEKSNNEDDHVGNGEEEKVKDEEERGDVASTIPLSPLAGHKEKEIGVGQNSISYCKFIFIR